MSKKSDTTTRPAFDWASTFVSAVLSYRRRCGEAGLEIGKPSPDTSGFEGDFVLRDEGGVELGRFACDGLGRLAEGSA